MLNERIPLTKVKTMRKTLSEKNMLNNFLKEHAYRLSQISSRGSNITIHPLRNIMDVSVLGTVLHSTPWCSSLALGLIWRWDEPSGMLRLGLLQEAETLGNRDPTQRRRHSHPQILVLVTGPSNDQVAGKHPFLCQRCVISLREIVPSELSEPLSHRWRVNHYWSKGRNNQLPGNCESPGRRIQFPQMQEPQQ